MEIIVSGIFLFLALVLLGVVGLLTMAPALRLLNFVHYETTRAVIRINRYAANRLLLPAVVFLGGAYLTDLHPELSLALLFLGLMSILAAVVWIAAGVTRLQHEPSQA
ncbi:hypothetical protein B0920_06130 [Massilia sp. KIM]|nr:hypothetical protein B0920_06130 [Massilia sp. KIM]